MKKLQLLKELKNVYRENKKVIKFIQSKKFKKQIERDMSVKNSGLDKIV